MNGIREKIGNRIAVLNLLFLTLVSCGKTGTMVGEEIRFLAKSEGNLTKTSYGVVVGSKQRIDWVVPDDTIRIVSPQARTAESLDYADYAVYEIIPNSNVVSVGRITPIGGTGTGLLWWSNTSIAYTFYALYPSPLTEGMSDISIAANSNELGKASLFLPTKQSMVDWNTVPGESGRSIVGSPDMRYAYMGAGRQGAYVNSGLYLTFYPLFSALQIRIAADRYIPLTSFKLRSNSSALVNRYEIELTPSSPGRYNVSSNSNFNEITVPLTGVRVIARDTLDITVFMLPHAIKDLTISFSYFQSGTEITRSFPLRYSNGDPIVFNPDEAHFASKYLISGLNFPTRSSSQVARGTKSPIPAGSPVDSFEDGVEMRDGVICLNMADEKFNHEWY